MHVNEISKLLTFTEGRQRAVVLSEHQLPVLSGPARTLRSVGSTFVSMLNCSSQLLLAVHLPDRKSVV